MLSWFFQCGSLIRIDFHNFFLSGKYVWNCTYSTGVLGFDPEKDNHKLNLFTTSYDHTEQMIKLPEFPTLVSSFKNTFQNGRHLVWAEFGFAIISVLETHRNLVLVAMPIFSGSSNPIRQVNITLGILVYAAILNFEMATTTLRPKLVFPIYRYMKLIQHLVLVSLPTFSGSMNTIKAIMLTLGHSFWHVLPSWISQWPPPCLDRNWFCL